MFVSDLPSQVSLASGLFCRHWPIHWNDGEDIISGLELNRPYLMVIDKTLHQLRFKLNLMPGECVETLTRVGTC